MCGNASHRLSMPRRHYTEVRAWRWNATSITSSAGTRGRLLVVGGVVLPGQQRCSCLRSDEHTGSSTRLWCFSGCRLTAVCTLGDLEPVPCLERVDLLQLVSELPLQRLGQLRLKTFRMSTACFFQPQTRSPPAAAAASKEAETEDDARHGEEDDDDRADNAADVQRG